MSTSPNYKSIYNKSIPRQEVRDELKSREEQKDWAPDKARVSALCLYITFHLILRPGKSNVPLAVLISSFLREKIFCLIIPSSCNFNGLRSLFESAVGPWSTYVSICS